MFACIYCHLACLLLVGPPDSWEMVRHLHQQLRDATFIYETDMVIPDPKFPKDGAKHSIRYISGTGKVHQDGVYYFEYQSSTKTGDTLHKFSIERDGESREFHGLAKPRSTPSQYVGKTGLGLIANSFSFGYVWPVGMLAGAAKSVLATAEDLGETRINDRPCRTFRLSPATKMQLELTFDLERNGQVVDYKMLLDNELRFRVHSYEFANVRGQDGKHYWFPVECSRDVYVMSAPKEKKLISLKKPVQPPTKYRILPESIQLNTGLSRDSLVLRLDPKGLIATDEMAKTSPKLMQEIVDARRPVSAEEVEKAVADAVAQEAELRSARLPPANDWLSWMPLVAAVLGCLGLIGAFFWWRRTA